MKGGIKGFGAAAVVAFVLGAAVAVPMMYIAWNHNPQGEIHEVGPDGALLVHWRYWLGLGASWFVTIFVSVVALAGVVRVGTVLFRRRTAALPLAPAAERQILATRSTDRGAGGSPRQPPVPAGPRTPRDRR